LRNILRGSQRCARAGRYRKGRWKNGVVSTLDAVYHDIVPEARIVYSYAMHLNEAKISVSLATLELERPVSSGTAASRSRRYASNGCSRVTRGGRGP